MIVTDSSHPPSCVDVVDVGVFDHMLVTWTVDISSPAPRYVTISRRAWKSFDFNAFRNELSVSKLCTQPIFDPNNATGINDLVNQFQLITTNLLDEFAPVRPITVREHVHNPWFNVELRDTRRKVRLLERRLKMDKAPALHGAWRSALCGSRKNNHVKAAEYWKAKISSAGNDSRSVWRTVNGILGDVRMDNQPTFSAEDYHNCINKKTADIRAARRPLHLPHFRNVTRRD